MQEEVFKKWLEREGYQPTTINTTLSALHVVEQRWAKEGRLELTATQKPLLKRYSRFLHSVPCHEWQPFDQLVADGVEAAVPGAIRGSSIKNPLTRAQWRALFARVSDSAERVDKALVFILSVPTLEPSAILRLSFEQLAKHLTPALRERLRPLPRKSYASLGDYISESERGAYVRVHRRLQKLGAELGFEVDFRSIARTPASVRAGGS